MQKVIGMSPRTMFAGCILFVVVCAYVIISQSMKHAGPSQYFVPGVGIALATAGLVVARKRLKQ